jgi:predicted enzyme related to lactoylglutathione lyase
MTDPMTTHGALSWSELHTAETERSHDFYTKLFRWDTKVYDMPGGPYTELRLGERGFGGVVAASRRSSAWLGYFTVDDVDAACAAARTLGGRVVVEPFDAPPGRIARLADPAGAEFFVIRYRPAT